MSGAWRDKAWSYKAITTGIVMMCVSGAWRDKAWSYKAITTDIVMMCVCQELGVTKLGHIKRLQQALNELKKQTSREKPA